MSRTASRHSTATPRNTGRRQPRTTSTPYEQRWATGSSTSMEPPTEQRLRRCISRVIHVRCGRSCSTAAPCSTSPSSSGSPLNGQRALDQVARRCAADRACARAFPSWPSQLRSLIASWNAKPRQVTPAAKLTGNDFAGVVQSMTRTAADAAEIPLVVSRAAARKYAPLAGHLSSSGPMLAIMYWSIWCNESWVGLDAAGPWGTYLDGNTEAALAEYRTVCSMFPRHDEPASSRTRVRSGVPLLALVGGADPRTPSRTCAGFARRCRRAASSSCPTRVTRSDSTAVCRSSPPAS